MQSDRQRPRGLTRYRKFALALIALTLFVAALSLVPVASYGAAAQPLGCRELLVNGGFEDGSVGWTQYSKLGNPLIDPFYPRTDKNGAWLGSQDNADDRLSQTVILPGASRITLSYWWAIHTEEPPGGSFDTSRTELLSSGGSVMTTTLVLDNDSAEALLWNEAVTDLTAYAGQSVQLRFKTATDALNPSSFFYDDVSIVACPNEGTPTVTPTPTATATVSPTVTPRSRLFLPLLLR